jgi:hypothetical protein
MRSGGQRNGAEPRDTEQGPRGAAEDDAHVGVKDKCGERSRRGELKSDARAPGTFRFTVLNCSSALGCSERISAAHTRNVNAKGHREGWVAVANMKRRCRPSRIPQLGLIGYLNLSTFFAGPKWGTIICGFI